MTTTRSSHSFSLGAVAALVALVAAMAALLIAYDASPARAAGDCSTTSGTTTCTFGPTGAEDTLKVPAGVSSVHVVAQGAPGAAENQGNPAGRGARVSGDLKVSSGQTLYVNVGGRPTGEDTRNCEEVDCIGGFNGGGSSFFGGGGGGASDVRTVSRDQSASLASRLIVAAGGGGSGFGTFTPCTPPALGGSGGDAEEDGFDGEPCDGGRVVGKGGKAGTQNAGGAGGGFPAEAGSLGRGGNGGQGAGGGGGGGYYGGGGGGGLLFVAPSGGGGGGSNLVPDGGTAAIASGAPSVTITYQGDCSITSGTTTCTFGPTGAEDTFKVPEGVSTIHVVAQGARGGSPPEVDNHPPGRGARVSGNLKVTPGRTLYVNVGGTGRSGGFNGGGSSILGGWGGGASDVRTISRDRDGSLDSRLIVAAGGGGSGWGATNDGAPCVPALGGGGGDAGSDGGDGEPCPNGPPVGTGGKAGTQNAGGDGGNLEGQSGSLGRGGNAVQNGGGGGGGYYGGGGGGGTKSAFQNLRSRVQS
jgi:Glycine rich protein